MASDGPALGLRQGHLRLVTHESRWADLFETEAALISRALPDTAHEILHIGSTSVPGLPAKPILDIAIRAHDHSLIAKALTGLGYIDRGMRSGHLFIRLRNRDVRTHNVHLYAPGDQDCVDQIMFRDALRADTKLRDQYAVLKRQLVDDLGDTGRGQYAGRKTDFVKSVLRGAQS